MENIDERIEKYLNEGKIGDYDEKYNKTLKQNIKTDWNLIIKMGKELLSYNDKEDFESVAVMARTIGQKVVDIENNSARQFNSNQRSGKSGEMKSDSYHMKNLIRMGR